MWKIKDLKFEDSEETIQHSYQYVDIKVYCTPKECSTWICLFCKGPSTVSRVVIRERPLYIVSVCDGVDMTSAILDLLKIRGKVFHVYMRNPCDLNGWSAPIQAFDQLMVDSIYPIDLVIGGSACNEVLSLKPSHSKLHAKKSSLETFVEYFRILTMIELHDRKRKIHFLYHVTEDAIYGRKLLKRFLRPRTIVSYTCPFTPYFNNHKYAFFSSFQMPKESKISSLGNSFFKCNSQPLLERKTCKNVMKRKRVHYTFGDNEDLFPLMFEREFGIPPDWMIDCGPGDSKPLLLARGWLLNLWKRIISKFARM